MQVMPGLYVGNLQDSKDSIQLEHHNITHIVSIHDTARRVFKVGARALPECVLKRAWQFVSGLWFRPVQS